MIPITVSIYDGVKTFSFYLSDYSNSDEMLKTALESILRRKYNKHVVYIHNLSNFDAIFLFRIMTQLGFMEPVINKGRIISVNLSYGSANEFYNIEFRDSYQILLGSLRNLSKSFNVSKKGIFPYNFVSEVDLNYIGNVPDYKYFTDISIDEYNSYSSKYNASKEWNLKNELIKYCEQDCISLYQVIDKFSDLIFNQKPHSFNVDNACFNIIFALVLLKKLIILSCYF